VTRIIGGEARGRRIQTPPGSETRPTADRVREALFSSLESELGTLVGRTFLDLYAGSGGVGLEARSRGAAVTLVERSARAASVIRANASGLGFDDVEVVVAAVARLRQRSAGKADAGPADVVFADPPYDYPTTSVAADLQTAATRGWLAASARVVVERDRRSDWRWPEQFLGVRERTYGETMLWYGLWALTPGEEV
jgi:16S rRNA (guanine966-N2)-methyltransferase